MGLPVELQAVVWGSVFLPTRRCQKRILTVGRHESWICNNGDQFEEEDPICIAKTLRLVSRHWRDELMNIEALRSFFLPTLPSHQRIIFGYGQKDHVPKYIRWDSQQDAVYLCWHFMQHRIQTINGGLPPFPNFGRVGWKYLGRPPVDDHPTWIKNPSSRPAHVMLDFPSFAELLALCSRFGTFETKILWLFSYFGIHSDPRDLLDNRVAAQERDLNRLDVTLQKITIVTISETAHELEQGVAKYTDLEAVRCVGPDRTPGCPWQLTEAWND